jgi:hypothetical protein
MKPYSTAESPEGQVLHRKVLRAFSRFVSRLRATDPVMFGFCQGFSVRGWEAVVFGGLPRDLVSGIGTSKIRDIDIVVHGVSPEDLADACAPWIRRRTRFGGLHLKVGDWPVDIWRLEDTWALRRNSLPLSLSQLPKTTFLTSESIAVSLHTQVGQERKVFAERFFESIASRVVDINYESNPYPELCVVRSLVTAFRLNVAIAPDLCVYIANVGAGMSRTDLEAVQLSHYGGVRYPGATLASCISRIVVHVENHGRTMTFWPAPRQQLTLLLEPAGNENR